MLLQMLQMRSSECVVKINVATLHVPLHAWIFAACCLIRQACLPRET